MIHRNNSKHEIFCFDIQSEMATETKFKTLRGCLLRGEGYKIKKFGDKRRGIFLGQGVNSFEKRSKSGKGNWKKKGEIGKRSGQVTTSTSFCFFSQLTGY